MRKSIALDFAHQSRFTGRPSLAVSLGSLAGASVAAWTGTADRPVRAVSNACIGVESVTSVSAAWQPSSRIMERVDSLIRDYRGHVRGVLDPLVRAHYPLLIDPRHRTEYRKMVELSTKMTLVGHALTESAGAEYDERRRMLASLYGSCCFLADSFIDDFGQDAARDYLRRFETLLTEGWFEPRSDRERLFYVIVGRLFAARDVLDPILRQAILRLYEAQRRDVELRLRPRSLRRLNRRRRLAVLKDCARDRSGHGISALAAFLLPDMTLGYWSLIFGAGALIMHIDDHGDCYADRRDRRVTYMNQVKDPVGALRRLFLGQIDRLHLGLPPGEGHDLMIAFFWRYYITRLAKHRQQKDEGGAAWAVYE